MNPDNRYLRLREVEQRLGVSRTTVWRWTAERGLKVTRIGGVSRIRESDLAAFLKRHEAMPAATLNEASQTLSPPALSG